MTCTSGLQTLYYYVSLLEHHVSLLIQLDTLLGAPIQLLVNLNL